MNIPEVLQQKIINDAFVMKKNDKDWLKIHNFLKSKYLKLKKTNNIYEEYFQYEIIHRPNGCFYLNKPYTWLNKFRNTNKYYYCNSRTLTNKHFNLS